MIFFKKKDANDTFSKVYSNENTQIWLQMAINESFPNQCSFNP